MVEHCIEIKKSKRRYRKPTQAVTFTRIGHVFKQRQIVGLAERMEMTNIWLKQVVPNTSSPQITA
jgi:hypothetical protein